jgi:ATP-dependent Clp protease ATP-binding subunit ClpC
MIEQFTESARQAVVLAQQEARRLDAPYLGTEHLLLGLLRDPAGRAAAALAESSVSLDLVRRRVEEIVGRGAEPPGPRLPFSTPARRAIEYALARARQQEHDLAAPEHLLLGVLQESGDTAVRVLAALGTDIERVRRRIIDSLA